ncbi:MAG: DUF4349 domain-containing protein [Ruminococcus sp.]|jgi:hypothetical protein|nr:DUF4349 domain-containing protein [Ruminococcus sp.]
MKKRLIPLIAVFVLALNACSSGSASSSYDGASAAAETAAVNYSDAMSANGAGYNESAGAELPDAEESEKMIIRNADITIQTLNLDETYGKLTAKLYELGGTIHTEQTEKTDFSAHANAVFKLPPRNLDAFVAYADECGRVTNKSISSEDITAQYIDTEIRLENKRRNLEKFYQYLDEAYNSEDVIRIQREIDQITSDIESYQGQLNYWSRSVAESQVNISIRQLQDPNEIEIEDVEFSTLSAENMGKIMSNGIKKCADVIITLFQWLIIIIVTLLPVILVVAVILAIIFLRRKFLDKKHPERVEERKLAKERINAARNYQATRSYQQNSTDNTNNPGYKKPPQ